MPAVVGAGPVPESGLDPAAADFVRMQALPDSLAAR
jgi:hypothetical protein